jgi:hypothetical protein
LTLLVGHVNGKKDDLKGVKEILELLANQISLALELLPLANILPEELVGLAGSRAAGVPSQAATGLRLPHGPPLGKSRGRSRVAKSLA